MFKFFRFIEAHSFLLTVMIFVAITIGGVVEVIPSFTQNTVASSKTRPYSALQLAGRQIYIKEGCNNCHSQLIRPFKSETDRYGDYSKSEEYVYDRPFLWGSRRIGPDLHRVGLIRSTDWHEAHFLNAQSTSPGSVMPNFTWFFENSINLENVYGEMHTIKTIFNVPYDKEDMPTLGEFDSFQQNILDEATTLAQEMKTASVKELIEKKEIPEVVALIAYLNSLK